MKAKKRTSDALTEIRTVASRAETALGAIKRLPYWRERSRRQGREMLAGGRNPERAADMIDLTGICARIAEDPEEPEMIAALEQVVALLERWRQ